MRVEMSVVSLHTIFTRYGGQRHPRIETYEVLKYRGELVLWKYVPSVAKALNENVR